MKIPGVFKPYLVVFQILDGYGQLWSPSGQFLGLLSSNQRHLNSIINPKGPYGSFYSPSSIQNPQGLYGSPEGIYSPYNPHCINPPVIFFRGQPLLVLTRNLNLYTNGLNIVDVDLMLTIYEELSNFPPEPIALRLETLGAALHEIANGIQDSETHRKYIVN
ncbi:MAG TPA: hypothetical protein DCE56_26245 [Cyanobacteria bacterium UBA8553]|nr:hypothetical protein [Cyanobacteria bacterium UBA8553]